MSIQKTPIQKQIVNTHIALHNSFLYNMHSNFLTSVNYEYKNECIQLQLVLRVLIAADKWIYDMLGAASISTQSTNYSWQTR